MNNIFIVNGPPGGGKTTFENLVVSKASEYGYTVFITSTIDFVKEIALKCGWNGEKTPKNRKFLSDLKDLLTQWNDVPFQQIQTKIKLFKFELWQNDLDPDKFGIIFIDCREPTEIKRLCKALNARSILIDRKDVDYEAVISNHADSEVYNYNYDIIIENNGSYKDFEQKIELFIKKDLV